MLDRKRMAEAAVAHRDIVDSNIFDTTSVSGVGEGGKRVSLIRHLQPKADEGASTYRKLPDGPLANPERWCRQTRGRERQLCTRQRWRGWSACEDTQ